MPPQRLPLSPNPYTMENPYAPPPPKRRWIKWVVLVMAVIVVTGGVTSVSVYLGRAAENRRPISRAWTYCRDLQHYRSSLGLVLMDDLIDTNNMKPELLEAAITQAGNGWITNCFAFGEDLQGDHAAVSITFTFANGKQITHQYHLVHIIEDTLWSSKNNWRIVAQGWNRTF